MVALSLSAFTGTYKKVPTGKGNANLHWFEAPYNAVNYQSTTLSVPLRIAENGCDGETVECERGFRDDQLIVTGVPGSGVKPGEKPKPEETIYDREN